MYDSADTSHATGIRLNPEPTPTPGEVRGYKEDCEMYPDDRLPFDDVSAEAAESLAQSWGYSECDETWSAMVGWATGLLHDGSNDED